MQNMKTAVLGGGALGSLFAAQLHAAGNDVTIVAREPRASLLAKEGVRVTGLAELLARVPVVADPAALREADLVINALKTYQSDTVLPKLKLAKPPMALSVQNGVYKNVELADAFGAGQVLGASALIGAEVQADGITRWTFNDSLLVGEPAGGDSERVAAVVAMLQGAGIKASASPDIQGIEWAKYTMIVPSFCLSLITRQETHRFLRHPDSARVYVALSREMVRLATAEGVKPAGSGGLPVVRLAEMGDGEAVSAVQAFGEKLFQGSPRHKVSGLQDLERGRPTEVEGLVGYAVRRAQALNLDLPVLRTCHWLCSAISPPAA
jgi:2-dehydropantoate 2-reductase